MSKILITPIGKGRDTGPVEERSYAEATYRFDDGAEYTTNFVAAALAQHLDIDKIFFVGTSSSMWEKVYDYFSDHNGGKKDLEYWTDLGDKVGASKCDKQLIDNDDLKKVNLMVDQYLEAKNNGSGGSKSFIINYGINQKELWHNFDLFMEITDYIEQGDEIYLDITHSFRSIPLFMYLLLDFIKSLNQKKIKITGVFYGMLELTHEKNYAPVIDLKTLLDISDWIKGTNEFLNYGKGYLIGDLINDSDLEEKFKEVSDAIGINYLKTLKNSIIQLNSYIEDKNNEKIPVFKHIKPYILDFIDRFKEQHTHSRFQFELAKWSLENKNYANVFLCLQESMITKIAEIYNENGEELEVFNHGDRKKVKKAFTNDEIEQHNENFKEFCIIYDKIRRKRNSIAHAKIVINKEKKHFNNQDLKDNNKKLNLNDDIKNIKKWCGQLENIFFNNPEINKIPKILDLNTKK